MWRQGTGGAGGRIGMRVAAAVELLRRAIRMNRL